MKRSLRITLLTMVALVAMLASSAAPALGSGMTLMKVTARREGPLILTFDAGNAYSGRLGGVAYVGYDSYPMHCGMNQRGKLVCRIGGGIYRHSGKTALISLGGQRMGVYIPDRPR